MQKRSIAKDTISEDTSASDTSFDDTSYEFNSANDAIPEKSIDGLEKFWFNFRLPFDYIFLQNWLNIFNHSFRCMLNTLWNVFTI